MARTAKTMTGSPATHREGKLPVSQGAADLLIRTIAAGADRTVGAWRAALGPMLEKTEVAAQTRSVFLWLSDRVRSNSSDGPEPRLASAEVLLRTLQGVPLGFVDPAAVRSRGGAGRGSAGAAGSSEVSEPGLSVPRRLEACWLGVEWNSKSKGKAGGSALVPPRGVAPRSAAGLVLAAAFRLSRFVRARLPTHVMSAIGTRS